MALISNNEIKKVKALQQKKFRDETGLFVVEGEKMVEEAIRSNFHVEAVYRRDEIGEDAMKRISALASPSPVLAVVRKPSDIVLDDISEATIPSKGLFLGLDTIRIRAILELSSVLLTGSELMQYMLQRIQWMYSIRRLSRQRWEPYSA